MPALDARALAARLDGWPAGHFEGVHEGRRYGVTLRRSAGGQRMWLYGEERGGQGVVSANLYRLADGRVLLRPCEMPGETVARFILGLRPERGT